MSSRDISVIIPVKPPEPYLEELISDIYVSFPEAEILVQKEKGLGNAIKAGVKKSSGNLIAVIDADGSHPPCFIRSASSMLADNEDLELIIGSRYGYFGYSFDELSRKIISLFFTVLTRLFLLCSVTDPLSGLVMARRRLFVNVSWGSGYKFGLSLLWYCKKKGLVVSDLGYHFKARRDGKSKANPLTALSFIRDLLFLRLRK